MQNTKPHTAAQMAEFYKSPTGDYQRMIYRDAVALVGTGRGHYEYVTSGQRTIWRDPRTDRRYTVRVTVEVEEIE